MHTTNYQNTFITVADDSDASEAIIPPLRAGKKTIAGLQFDMVYHHPYKYDSDDVIFGVYALQKMFEEHEMEEQRAAFFSKGQACLRASTLGKKFGWGIHANHEGKIAIYAVDSPEYASFMQDDSVKKVKAMRSKK